MSEQDLDLRQRADLILGDIETLADSPADVSTSDIIKSLNDLARLTCELAGLVDSFKPEVLRLESERMMQEASAEHYRAHGGDS